MSVEHTITKLGEMAAVASTATAIASIMDGTSDGSKSDLDLDNINHVKEMLEYLDGMAIEVRQVRQMLDEHNRSIAMLQERLDNVNLRVDNLADGV